MLRFDGRATADTTTPGVSRNATCKEGRSALGPAHNWRALQDFAERSRVTGGAASDDGGRPTHLRSVMRFSIISPSLSMNRRSLFLSASIICGSISALRSGAMGPGGDAPASVVMVGDASTPLDSGSEEVPSTAGARRASEGVRSVAGAGVVGPGAGEVRMLEDAIGGVERNDWLLSDINGVWAAMERGASGGKHRRMSIEAMEGRRTSSSSASERGARHPTSELGSGTYPVTLDVFAGVGSRRPQALDRLVACRMWEVVGGEEEKELGMGGKERATGGIGSVVVLPLWEPLHTSHRTTAAHSFSHMYRTTQLFTMPATIYLYHRPTVPPRPLGIC